MKLLQALKLLLPAIIPSWNFFDIIAPSPRIQFTLLSSDNESISDWYEFRPRPQHISFLNMLSRIFWNPKWNESLFLVSCAERIILQDTQNQIHHSETEILKRIKCELLNNTSNFNVKAATYFQFRLVFIKRQNKQLQEEVTYISRIQPLSTDNIL